MYLILYTLVRQVRWNDYYTLIILYISLYTLEDNVQSIDLYRQINYKIYQVMYTCVYLKYKLYSTTADCEQLSISILYLQEWRHSTIEVASTRYPRHKTHISWRLTSVSFTLPPLHGTTGSPNNFCSSHGGGGDDDDDMMMTTMTICVSKTYAVSILETNKKKSYYIIVSICTTIILYRYMNRIVRFPEGGGGGKQCIHAEGWFSD